MELLNIVLDLLNHHNLKLKVSKSFFLHTDIQFLGYKISNSSIKPTNDKIVAVEQFSVPLSIHQVRQFLGLTGYFRKFIPHYAEKSRPLTELLHKEVSWKWGTRQQESFYTLKQFLRAKPVLRIFGKNLECTLHTDAS